MIKMNGGEFPSLLVRLFFKKKLFEYTHKALGFVCLVEKLILGSISTVQVILLFGTVLFFNGNLPFVT